MAEAPITDAELDEWERSGHWIFGTGRQEALRLIAEVRRLRAEVERLKGGAKIGE